MAVAEKQREEYPPVQYHELLVHAIVMQSVKDYRTAIKNLRRYPAEREEHKRAFDLKQDIERFLRSRWFEALSPVDGGMLLQRLEAQEQN